MENILKNYFEERLKVEESLKSGKRHPVITISREFGCPSKMIGLMLTEALNKQQPESSHKRWKFINKEIVEESAKRLDLNPVEMSSILSSGVKGLVEDILKSFSPPYVSSHKVKKTLDEVIHSLASEGRMVIVGRGSAAILQGRPDTIHVRLHAPVEWRLQVICTTRNVDEKEGLRMLQEVDAMRASLVELLLGRKMEIDLFDMLFNCSRMNNDEIVQSIGNLVARRGLL